MRGKAQIHTHLPLETLETLRRMGCMRSIIFFLMMIGRRKPQNAVDSLPRGSTSVDHPGRDIIVRPLFPIGHDIEPNRHRPKAGAAFYPFFQSQEFRCSRFSIGFPFPNSHGACILAIRLWE